MSYAKLVNGKIVFAPRKLRSGDTVVYNPPMELLKENGYKPVINTDAPEAGEGNIASPGWTETEEAIVQTWTIEPERDIADAEVLEILLGGEST